MAEAKLPASIEVGPFTYTVTEDETELLRKCRQEKTDLLGHLESRSLSIILDCSQAPGMLRDTVLHEVLHALFGLNGLADEWDKEREEAVVARLSPVLLDVLRRNPAFVAFLVAS